MATLVLHTSRDPQRLLAHAADGFLDVETRSETFPTPSYWLILRQGGLRDDLFAAAGRAGVPGWFDPPIALFQELPDLLADFDRAAIGDYERVVLVGRALRESAGAAFRRLHDIDAYVDAVDRWIGELIAEGITPAQVASWSGATPRDGFAARRDTELVRTYERYLALLNSGGLRDPRARLIECAAALAGQHDESVRQRLGGRREVRLVGLSDPRGGWSHLLRTLGDSTALDRIAVYASDVLPFLTSLGAETVDLDPAPHFAGHVFSPESRARPDRPAIDLLSAPDMPREIEEVATRVRALVDRGTPPHRIGVVMRSARPYSSHMIRALERLGVPASARRRHALAEVPAVRALLALFRVAAEGWERLGLVELAETPYFRARLDAGVLNHIGYQRRVQGLDAWREALRSLAREAAERERQMAAEPEGGDARGRPLPAHERVIRAIDDFEAFSAQAVMLNEPRSVERWLEWLTQFLESDPWKLERTMYRAPADRLDSVRLDTVAWRGMRQIVSEWRSGEARWGHTDALDVSDFEARLRSVLSGDVALFTPARRGVQVVEGLAAAFRSFDHVFIMGLDSGRMPLRTPRSPLFDEYDRLAMREAGMPIDTRAEWEEREQALFRNLLACAADTLTLSYARYDETGAEQLPSSFLEEVQYTFGLEVQEIAGSRAFTPSMPLVDGAAALERAVQGARAERERATGAASAYAGMIETPEMRQWLAAELGDARIWSPTQIEMYAKCPWSYFSARLLRVEKLEDPDLDIDPRTRGSVLHDALRRFYSEAKAHTSLPIHLLPVDLIWARPLAEAAIAAAIDSARGSLRVGHPALEAQKLEELRRQLVAYIEWEAGDNERAMTNARVKNAKWVRTGVVEHEVPFDDILLEVDGVRVRFRGFIDRVEQGMDDRADSAHLLAAVDYKTTKYSTPAAGAAKGWEDGVVLQVPLYAYALTQIRPGTSTARVEYRTIRNPEHVHALPLYQVDRKAGLTHDPNQQELYERALKDVARQVVAARSGVFAPLPPPSCTCPPFCHARDICRIAGGPRDAS